MSAVVRLVFPIAKSGAPEKGENPPTKPYTVVNEVREGNRIELEHRDLFRMIRDDVKKNGKVTMTDNDMAAIIRAAHNREDKHYYAKLISWVEQK
jgi:uncharacterized protein YpuA (DUF1002 family)